jgi:hypothetical protein
LCSRFQLTFPDANVQIENVDVGKLITFFDYFDIDLDNVVNVKAPEDGVNIDYRARQTRLNHKPFTYNIYVASDKALDAYVRVFLGPKNDYLGREYNINDRRHYFVEIDRFPYKSKSLNWGVSASLKSCSRLKSIPYVNMYRARYRTVTGE